MEQDRLIDQFVELKDVAFDVFALVAFGKLTIPATMQTQEFPAIFIHLRNVKEPLIVTYETEAARDAALAIVHAALEKAR